VKSAAFQAHAADADVDENAAHEGSTIRATTYPPFGAVDEDDLRRTVSEVPGRYESLEEYARGGMGRIIRVRDLFLDREIALKELLPGPRIRGMGKQVSSEPTVHARRLFLDEARTTGRLQHPSIVPVHEIGQRPDGTLYYTMKLVKGRPLSQAIRAADGLGDRLALLPNFLDVCHAIAYAHSQGVIHRDIKPRNIMIGEFAETVVIDWGLALDMRACHQDPARMKARLNESTPHSPYADALGTPAYMAPEQALGKHHLVSERSDVYALGAVLYKLLTGKSPFKGASLNVILHKVVHDPPAPVNELEPDVPPELMAVCERAMAKDPSERFSSALALAEEIERFQAGALLRSYRYNAKDRLLRWLRRNQPIVAAGAAAMLALILLTLYSYIEIVRQKNEAQIAQLDAEAATSHARMGLEEARRAQQQSDQSREQAFAASEAAEQSLYSAYISLAQNHMAQGSYARASGLLAECAAERRHWEWGHLQYVCNQDYHTYAIPAAGVRVEALDVPAAAFNPTTSHLLIQQADGSIHIVNFNTSDLLGIVEGEQRNHYLEPFYSAGSRYLGMIDNENCLILDPIRFETLYKFPLQQHWQWRAQFSGDERRIAVRQQVDTIGVYDLDTGEAVNTLTIDPVFSIAAINSDGTLVATFTASGGTGATGVLRLIRVSDGSILGERDDVQVRDLCFEKSGGVLLTLGDGGFSVFRPDAFQAPELLHGTAEAQAMAWSPDGLQLAVGMSTGEVLLYRWPELTLSRRVAAHTGAVTALAFDLGGSRLATGGEDRLIRVWDTAEATPLHRFEGHSDVIQRLVFHEQEPLLYSASLRSVKLWSLDRHEQPAVLAGQEALTAASDTEGQHLFTADAWGVVKEHTLANGSARILLEPEGARSGVPLLNFGASRLLLASDDTFELWDVAERRKLMERSSFGALGTISAFSNDGTLLAVMYGAKAVDQPVIEVFDAANGALVKSIRPFLTSDLEQYHYAALGFTPDNKQLSCVVGDACTFFHLEGSEREASIPIPQQAGLFKRCVAFDDAGRFLAIGGCKSGIVLIDPSQEQSPAYLKGHSQPVTALSFSSDGARLISGGSDGLVKVWDTESGQELLNWQDLREPVKFVLFAGEHTLASGDGTQAAQIAAAFPWCDKILPGDQLVPVQERIDAFKVLDQRLNTPWGRCQARLRSTLNSGAPPDAGAVQGAAWSCEEGGELRWMTRPAVPECSVHGPLWNSATQLDLIEQVDSLVRQHQQAAVIAPASWLASAISDAAFPSTIQGWIATGRVGAAHGVCQVVEEGRRAGVKGFHQLAGDAAYLAGDVDAAIGNYEELSTDLQVYHPRFPQALLKRRSSGDVELAYSLLTQRFTTELPADEDNQTLSLLNLDRDPVPDALRAELRRLVTVDPLAWQRLAWHRDFSEACATAAETGKPIYLEINTTTAHTTQWLHERIYGHPEVWDVLDKQFVLCRLDAETAPDLLERYGVQHFPALFVIDSAGELLLADFDVSSPGAFQKILPPDDTGFVLSWRITGPHPIEDEIGVDAEVPEQPRRLLAELNAEQTPPNWYSFTANAYRPYARMMDITEPVALGTFYAWTRFDMSAPGTLELLGRFSHKFRYWIDGTYIDSHASDDLIMTRTRNFLELSPGPHELLVELQGEARHIFCEMKLATTDGVHTSTGEMPACPEVKNTASVGAHLPIVPIQRDATMTHVRVRKSDVLEKWRENYLQYLAILNPRPYPDSGPLIGIQSDRISEVPLLASLGLQDGDIVTGINGISFAQNQNWRELVRSIEGQRTYRTELLRNGQVHVLIIDVTY
jgi:serine/threonine protein kinase/WD40 repeat protein